MSVQRRVSGHEREAILLEILDETSNAMTALQSGTAPWTGTRRQHTVEEALAVLESAGAEAARLRRGFTTRTTPAPEDTRERLRRLQGGHRLAANGPEPEASANEKPTP